MISGTKPQDLIDSNKGSRSSESKKSLVSSKVAQEYNQRKNRKGAFWEDRYHATAIDTNEYLIRCFIYLDLNMVRAGVINHPTEWAECGYREIQQTPGRYRIIDMCSLLAIVNFTDVDSFRREYRRWVKTALSQRSPSIRDSS